MRTRFLINSFDHGDDDEGCQDMLDRWLKDGEIDDEEYRDLCYSYRSFDYEYANQGGYQ